MVLVRVMLFASYREAIGERQIELEVPAGSSVEALYSILSREHPGLEEIRPHTTFAVNREVVDRDHELHAGDEVAFLQPVSGGSGD